MFSLIYTSLLYKLGKWMSERLKWLIELMAQRVSNEVSQSLFLNWVEIVLRHYNFLLTFITTSHCSFYRQLLYEIKPEPWYQTHANTIILYNVTYSKKLFLWNVFSLSTSIPSLLLRDSVLVGVYGFTNNR